MAAVVRISAGNIDGRLAPSKRKSVLAQGVQAAISRLAANAISVFLSLAFILLMIAAEIGCSPRYTGSPYFNVEPRTSTSQPICRYNRSIDASKLPMIDFDARPKRDISQSFEQYCGSKKYLLLLSPI